MILRHQKKKYKEHFFETLKRFPDYYKKVKSAKNDEERRTVLIQIYSEMKKENTWDAATDLKMLYQYRRINSYCKDFPNLKRIIKERDLKHILKKGVKNNLDEVQ